MKRVLFLLKADGIGGVERKVSTLLDAFNVRGIQGEVAALTDSPVPRGLLADRHVRVLESRLPTQVLKRLDQRRQLRALIRGGGYDAVLAFGPSPNALASLARDSKTILVLSEVGNPFIAKRRTWNATVMRVYRRADALVTYTSELAEKMQTLPAVCPRTVVAIPNVLSPHVPLVPPSSTRRPEIVTVGRLVASKRVGDLIEAFARVAPVFPEWRLTIVGDGPERPALERLASTAGLKDRIRFTGFLTEPWHVMANASIFAMASAHEGFANVLMEAAASGCTVVSSDCQFGPKQILMNGELGLLYPVGDVASLTTHLTRLIENPAHRHALAERVQASTVRYRVDTVAASWLELLETCRRQADRV